MLLCSLFLSSITVFPPFCSPPPACSYLSAVKDFDRKGNPTLGMGQRWRREQEPSRACVPAALQSERPSTRCAIGSLSDMLAEGLASVTNGNFSNILVLHQQKSSPPHGGGHKRSVCQHCSTTVDIKELRTGGIERVTEELITSLQHVGCLYKYGGRKKGGGGVGVKGGSRGLS